jgi:hypothetical protein
MRLSRRRLWALTAAIWVAAAAALSSFLLRPTHDPTYKAGSPAIDYSAAATALHYATAAERSDCQVANAYAANQLCYGGNPLGITRHARVIRGATLVEPCRDAAIYFDPVVAKGVGPLPSGLSRGCVRLRVTGGGNLTFVMADTRQGWKVVSTVASG